MEGDSKTFLDSGFQVLDPGCFVSGPWIADSLSCIPDSKAQDSGFHGKNLLDSGFHEQKFSGLPYMGWEIVKTAAVKTSVIEQFFVWSWKMVSVRVRYLFISQRMKRSKHGLFVLPPKRTLIWRRHFSVGQLRCSIMSKQSIGWFLESSLAYKHLYLFEKPIKSLYFRSFDVSVLFACFHFKVIRKSL